MPDGEQTVFCPHCGYPYKMSAVQVEVYRGRNMGCMHCGRPFLVDPPTTKEPAIDTSAVGESGVANSDSAAAASQPAPASSTPAATAASGPAGPKPNGLGVVSICCGVGFLLLLAVGAIVGFVAGGTGEDLAAQTVSYVVLSAALVVGLLATLFGVLGYLRSKKPMAGGRGASVAGAALGVTGLLVGGCLLSVLIPTFDKARGQSQKDACRSNLVQIGTALDAYLKAKANRAYPADLGGLVVEGRVPAEMLVCPADHSTTPPATQPSTRTSYTYLAAGRLRQSTPATFVVAHEPATHHSDGLHVLFADGTVVFVSTAQAAPLLKELQVGQNPPASAASVRND